MTHEAKTATFLSMIPIDAYHKSTIDNLPLQFTLDSKIIFLNWDAFTPLGNFTREQILKMIEICANDFQVLNLLTALKRDIIFG